MSVKAFVLIVVDPAKTVTVFEQLRAVSGIAEVYQVMGDEKAAARFQRLALAEAREAGDRRGAAELGPSGGSGRLPGSGRSL